MAREPQDLINEIVDCCTSTPEQAIALAATLDFDRLTIGQDLDVHHALATAQWYADRDAGWATLARMWHRFGASGRLFTAEVADLLAHYGASWEQVARNTAVQAADPKPNLQHEPDLQGEITLGIIGGARVASSLLALRSFLAHCTDAWRTSRRINVADCPAEDCAEISKRFPRLEQYAVGPDRHAQLRALAEFNRAPLVFLIDADHELFATSAFIDRCRAGVMAATSVGQCLVNLGYANSLDVRQMVGMPFPHRGETFVAHLYAPDRERPGFGWPHFCLRPSMVRAEVLQLVAEHGAETEREMARRFTQAGWRSVFLPDVYHGPTDA